MKLSIFSDGSEPVPFASPASNVVCSVSPGGKESSPCQSQGQRYHLFIHAALPPSYFLTFPSTFLCTLPTRECTFFACPWWSAREFQLVLTNPCPWRSARFRQIASRRNYSIAYSIQITQMFIATSATTGGEGWTFGRLAGLFLHGAVVSDALWQQVEKNWLTWV